MMDSEYRFRVREMRKNPTPAEKTLWELLRSRQLRRFKFRRQHPIGPFVTDFCCPQKRLVIELDGAHHRVQSDEDAKRTAFLKEQGFTVVRFWNQEIERSPLEVLEKILAALDGIQRN